MAFPPCLSSKKEGEEGGLAASASLHRVEQNFLILAASRVLLDLRPKLGHLGHLQLEGICGIHEFKFSDDTAKSFAFYPFYSSHTAPKVILSLLCQKLSLRVLLGLLGNYLRNEVWSKYLHIMIPSFSKHLHIHFIACVCVSIVLTYA